MATAIANPKNANLSVGPAGIALIKEKEGWYPKAYKDPVGVWTIGWGTTGAEAVPGRVITKEQGEAFLKADLKDAENDVKRLVKVVLNQNEFDALVSFVYNLGAGAIASSTLLKLLNRGNRVGAAGQFALYNHAHTEDGKLITLPGLTKRRAEEQELFLRDVDVQVDPASWNMEDQAELDPATHDSGVQPSPPAPEKGAFMQVVKNSDTFKMVVFSVTGFLTALSQLLEPLKQNPVALGGALVAIAAIGGIVYIKTRDTAQGR